jgi:hypothetical protein
MPTRKRSDKMTDKELVRRLFPKPVRKALKTAFVDLDTRKSRRKSRKKR